MTLHSKLELLEALWNDLSRAAFPRVAPEDSGRTPAAAGIGRGTGDQLGSGQAGDPAAAHVKLRILERPSRIYSQPMTSTKCSQTAWVTTFSTRFFSDVDALSIYAGIHQKVFGLHRALSQRFPFAIYYELAEGEVPVHAVLDCRRNTLLDTAQIDRTLNLPSCPVLTSALSVRGRGSGRAAADRCKACVRECGLPNTGGKFA